MSPTFRFIPAMYRKAVVERVKTQTRRVMSPQPLGKQWQLGVLSGLGTPYRVLQMTEHVNWAEDVVLKRATYGPPGTILPVVTTWAVSKEWDDLKPSIMDPEVVLAEHGIWWDDGSPKPAWAGKLRPSMFVPRAFYPHAVQARVEAVKAEAVQDISAEDAIAEGVDPFQKDHPAGGTWLGFRNYLFDTANPSHGVTLTDEQHRVIAYSSPIASFRSLWDSINAERGEGQYAWNRNPMVFATSFSILPVTAS